MKTFLIAIGTILFFLLFTSCEKEEMGIGEGAGGGKEDANLITKSAIYPILKVKTNENTLVADTTLKIDG